MSRSIRLASAFLAAILWTVNTTGCSEERESARAYHQDPGMASTKDWTFDPPSLDVQRLLIELDSLYESGRATAVIYCPGDLYKAPDSTFRLLVPTSEAKMLILDEIDEAYRSVVSIEQVASFNLLDQQVDDERKGQCDDGKYNTVDPIRPVPLGVTAGIYGDSPGTLGGRAHDGKQIYALSNAHVFDPPGMVARRGSNEVVQPGYDFARGTIKQTPCLPTSTTYPHAIAILTRSLPIHWSSRKANRVDAAIAETDERCIKKEMAEAGDGYKTPSSVAMTWEQVREILQGGENLTVQKRGMMTCLRTGKLRCIARRARITDRSTNRKANFVNQWIIEGAFAEPGDSGSLVVTKSSGEDHPSPVGLLFASTGRYFAANPIDQVLCCLGVAIDGDGPSSPPDPATCQCTHPIDGADPGTWEDRVDPETARRLKDTVARNSKTLFGIDGAKSVVVRPELCSRGPCILMVIEEKKNGPVDPGQIPSSIDGFPVVPILEGFEILPGDL